MRILLTGVTGQVGAALLAPLRGLGELIEADRNMLDLSRPDQIAAALDRLRPDIIVNPAAYTAVDLAEEQADLALRVNAESPEAMARWAVNRAVPLVHFSTDYVFDGSAERPWLETDAPSPLQVYGASKLAGENAIRSTGCPALILRTSWVYASTGRNFLRTMAMLARERSELTIVADQIGAPTSARAIAAAVARMLSHGDRLDFSDQPGCQVINLSAQGQTSWHGFAEAIIAGLRERGVSLAVRNVTPIETANYPTKARRPLYSVLDHTRLQQVGIVMPLWSDALAVELDDLQIELSRDLTGQRLAG
jgi:dTDP-4-dehydrorhamnose reductase